MSLKSNLNELASSFADQVIAAIRSASIQELLGDAARSARRGPGRPPSSAASLQRTRTTRSARLPRRSPEQIAAALDKVVALVKKNPKGLRAEQIRDQLGMQSKEMPRLLTEGLAKRKLKSKGQRRATTYFVV